MRSSDLDLTRVTFHAPPEDAVLAAIPGRIRIFGGDIEPILEAFERHRSRVDGIHYLGDLASFHGAERFDGQRLVWYASRVTRPLVEYGHRLPRPGTVVRLGDASCAFEDVHIAASMGLVPDVRDLVPDLDAAELDRLLEFYVHHQALEVPVEPFHGLLTAQLDRTEAHLWMFHLYWPERFLFVNGDGQIALSYEDLGRGEFVGRLGEDPAAWERSASWTRMTTFLANIPAKQADCLACRFFFLCRGWPEFRGRGCAAWRHVAERLLDVANDVRELRGQAARSGWTPGGPSDPRPGAAMGDPNLRPSADY